MAPREPQSAPLADFFWIAGVDATELLEQFVKLGEDYRAAHPASIPSPVTDTIQEDADAEACVDHINESLARLSSTSSNCNSAVRLSRSENPRDSIHTITVGETESNRSSITVKGPNENRETQNSSYNGFLSEADFDKALFKFAAERESFLADLTLSTTTPPTAKPKPKPKTQRIIAEDVNQNNNNMLRSGIGSVRRHMSFRDMNSMKRQPSVVRHSSVRNSRRLSNYNSVTPVPQPLDVPLEMHPLKRKFEPVLLDRYPPKTMSEETKARGNFPDFVPMFAFPNDISIISSDQRPRSTWHGFAMTSGDGSKIYSICVIIWIPLNNSASDELEKRCEEWRRDNMTDEERELAASLGERLAQERARLSRLLAQLPTVVQGSEEREHLEEDISGVEEKISLMADLLRPVRHGAASKIEGLTDGDTGFWIPRAYGILGRDVAMCSFWKEWLRAVVTPMTDGAVLRVPPTSPRVGRWQPLERYVVNLCTEAFSPISSKTQVELAVRELRLFARKEAVNELPGSRNTDLYALFRCLSVSNVMILFEYALVESRIILLSSHTSMLHLASHALVDLLFPFIWAGVFIPVLPARLIQALEAPCPYIVGIDRRYEKTELPSDDFVLVDLDNDEIESTTRPIPLPRHHRRKLHSLLTLAAPLQRYGVRPGPPAYAVETYPYDSFPSENENVTSSTPKSTELSKYVGISSTSFAQSSTLLPPAPNYNAFLNSRNDTPPARNNERPVTGSTSKSGSASSPSSTHSPSHPMTPTRTEPTNALQASLREKRSGYFDAASRRSTAQSADRMARRQPSLPFLGHATNVSVTTLNTDPGMSVYAPSVYAQSTVAASTIMPMEAYEPTRTETGSLFVEGHCLSPRICDDRTICSICDEKAEDKMYSCSGCRTTVHERCAPQITLVCPAAFKPDQVRAAFVRCFASLLYTYKKFMRPASMEKRRTGLMYQFQMDAFLKSLPTEHAEYMVILHDTQAFNEFISDRERATPKTRDPRITLFDEIILSKRNRGRPSLFSSRLTTDFLHDTSDHLWRSASAGVGASIISSNVQSDYKAIVTRSPAKLDPNYMQEPRMVQGAPRISKAGNARDMRRKPVASAGGGAYNHAYAQQEPPLPALPKDL